MKTFWCITRNEITLTKEDFKKFKGKVINADNLHDFLNEHRQIPNRFIEPCEVLVAFETREEAENELKEFEGGIYEHGFFYNALDEIRLSDEIYEAFEPISESITDVLARDGENMGSYEIAMKPFSVDGIY